MAVAFGSFYARFIIIILLALTRSLYAYGLPTILQ